MYLLHIISQIINFFIILLVYNILFIILYISKIKWTAQK